MAGRIHNALTGLELKAAILVDIKEALDADIRFEAHLTFPIVDWDWDLKIQAYPVAQPEMRLKVEGEIQNWELIAQIKKTAVPPVVEILKKARKVGPEGQAPDEVRVQTGQGVSVPMKSNIDVTFEMMEGTTRR